MFRKVIVAHFFYRDGGCNRLLGNVVRFMVCDTFRYYAENGNLCNFYCCTVHFDNTEILITNKCTPLLHI